eukprot:SAG31_NODE_20406_length_575_cov_1.949580_1_plen_160_part_10
MIVSRSRSPRAPLARACALRCNRACAIQIGPHGAAHGSCSQMLLSDSVAGFSWSPKISLKACGVVHARQWMRHGLPGRGSSGCARCLEYINMLSHSMIASLWLSGVVCLAAAVQCLGFATMSSTWPELLMENSCRQHGLPYPSHACDTNPTVQVYACLIY